MRNVHQHSKSVHLSHNFLSEWTQTTPFLSFGSTGVADLIIRRMTFDDYEQVEVLFQKLHNIHADAEPDLYKPLDCIHKKRDFKKLVNSKSKILLCAEDDGKIIGVSDTKFCTSGMTDIKMAFMDALYVEDDFRGKGIGKKLFYET